MESTRIALASDTISSEELSSAAAFLKSGRQLTKGPETLAFESEFAAYMGSRYAVFVNSGSSANLLVASALKESGALKNNVVICPAVSWVTTVTPFTHLGFDVVMCDADKSSLGVDIVELERLFHQHEPSLLVIVHVLGHANNMRAIEELCLRFGVVLVEDTCEALGTKVPGGRALGTIGLAGTFSFYYGHHISTIEGGMVVTDDFDLWQVMLSMRSHGWTRDLDPVKGKELRRRYKIDDFQSFYTFFYPGFNFRSTDLQASIGRGQLEKLPGIVRTRQKNFHLYKERLSTFWGQESDSLPLSSFAYGTAVKNRAEVGEALANRGIEARPLICGNIARHPFWMERYSEQSLPVADFIHEYGIYLPNHANLNEAQVKHVVETFIEFAIPAFPPDGVSESDHQPTSDSR